MRSFSKLFGQSQAPTAAATNQPAKLTLWTCRALVPPQVLV